ncbi:hypothetical protein [Streptomyces chartreusis]|uniref:hypothetical protein n=1 Tax=Streptomyces chartreusis TaxID=1969 RepID=UPI0033B0AB96
MTPLQTQRRQGDPCSVTVLDGMDVSGPRVRDDMTVEVALSVMAGARVEHLILCDADDQCTGSVTRAELAVHRGSSAYTDRIRLRDVLGEHGRTPGVLALSS